MLRYKTKPRPGLVALYDIWPGNGAGQFLQPRSPHTVHRARVYVNILHVTEWRVRDCVHVYYTTYMPYNVKELKRKIKLTI